MPRVSSQEFFSLPDVSQSWFFDLIIPAIPGGGDNAALRTKVRATQLPTSDLEQIPVELAGIRKHEAGRATYQSPTFTTKFLETIDYTTFQALRAWRDLARSWKNNTGALSSNYKATLELDMYGADLVTIGQTVKFIGVFPTSLGAYDFSGMEAATIIDMEVTWSFDYLSDGTTF